MKDILHESDDVIAQVQAEKLRAMLTLCARGHP